MGEKKISRERCRSLRGSFDIDSLTVPRPLDSCDSDVLLSLFPIVYAINFLDIR